MNCVKNLAALLVVFGLAGSQAWAGSFVPDNPTPVDWNSTATWKEFDGSGVGIPGSSTSDNVKIGRTVASGVVDINSDVDVTLNGQAGSANFIGVLEIASKSPVQVSSGRLEIQSTGGGLLTVAGATVLGQNGDGDGTLLQSGGDVNYSAGDSAFATDGANTLAEFSGGTATIGRLKNGANSGAVAHGGNNVLKVSGGHVKIGNGAAFSDARLYRESSLLVTAGILEDVNSAGLFDYSGPADTRAVVDISGGVAKGFDRISGPAVTVSGGQFIVGNNPTAGAALDRTSLEERNIQSTFVMSSGETVFTALQQDINNDFNISHFRLLNSSVLDLTGGTVVVDFSLYSPSVGDTFDLIDERTATFIVSNSNLSAAPAGMDWDTSQWQSDGILTLVTGTVPEPSSVLLVLCGVGSLLSVSRKRR